MSGVVELARARTKIIHRMPGRGDLWIFVDAGAMLVRTDQLEQLAGLESWSGDGVLFDDREWFILDGFPCTPIETALARCESAGTTVAAAFLEWMREVLDTLDDDVLDQAQRLPGFIGSHPVHVAARILSTDPTVDIGRDSLFGFMAGEGWLSRGQGEWEITHLARRQEWLTVRHVLVPGRGRRSYPQVYVTPAGLTELQRLLTVGRRQTPPTPSTLDPLFD